MVSRSTFSDTLLCPYTHKLMNDAVVLNCGDTISEVAKKALTVCPVCSGQITDSFPNLLLRRQVSLLQKEEAKEGERGGYPLARAEFVKSKDWKKCNNGLTWTYAFVPKSPDSFITIVQFQGYRNGTTSLYVDYQKLKTEETLNRFKDYLEANGVGSHSVGWPPNNSPLDGENIQKLFAILTANNDFPADDLKLLQNLIDNCHNWRNGTR